MIGLELLENDPDVEVLVSDLLLPGPFDGLELCARAVAHRPDLKCLLISAHILEGFDDRKPKVHVLQKPFELSEFDEALAMVAAS